MEKIDYTGLCLIYHIGWGKIKSMYLLLGYLYKVYNLL